MYWGFTAGGISYKGYLDSATLYSVQDRLFFTDTTVYILNILNFSVDSISAHPTLVIDMSRVNHNVTVGSYYPYINQYPDPDVDFTGYISYVDKNGVSYEASRALLSFSVVLSTYDLNTRLVQGTFSGPVLNAAGQTVNITNGYFKTYMAH